MYSMREADPRDYDDTQLILLMAKAFRPTSMTYLEKQARLNAYRLWRKQKGIHYLCA